jgi:hypothetical protein
MDVFPVRYDHHLHKESKGIPWALPVKYEPQVQNLILLPLKILNDRTGTFCSLQPVKGICSCAHCCEYISGSASTVASTHAVMYKLVMRCNEKIREIICLLQARFLQEPILKLGIIFSAVHTAFQYL